LDTPAKPLTFGAFTEMLNEGLGHRFITHHGKNQRDLLAGLCDKYGSDKGELSPEGHPYPAPAHNFTELYSRLFAHCRHAVRKVFECGLGTNNTSIPSNMGARGRPGASLRVWRDYFPNAVIYGADIDRDILFTEDRIKTFYMDQCDPAAIQAFWQQVDDTGFDFMVDDGLHIFEDVTPTDLLRYKQFFSTTPYSVDFVTMLRPNRPLADNSLVVIRKG
jgi:hypothetical protein